ncbi:MAG TPA: PAS domain S-box protein [Dehalococcoidia bacterium]|nr:PAS domain S-box protein [Dehalococcoidia bacterium]
MVKRLSQSWVTRVIRRPGFWLLIAILILITLPHYAEELKHPAFLSNIWDNLGLDRHAFERILYLAPIVWAGFLFGQRGAFIVSLIAIAIMLPRALVLSEYRPDAISETIAVFVIGNVVAFSFGLLRRERVRRIQLSVLNEISSVVSKSLELSQLLDSSIDSVVTVMRADAALVFLLDEKTGELMLVANEGVSKGFAQNVSRIKLGEGFNGKVAETGEPLFVEDVSQESGSATSMELVKEGIKSQIIVPLKSKGAVVGTICVAMCSHRRFSNDEVELLNAIGNQIGVAVENARLYEHEREFTKQLKLSEERYRELFESANDAIWVHDLEGNLMAANKASEKLTGFTLEDLRKVHGLNVKAFLTEEGMKLAREIGSKLLANEPVAQPYEQRIIRKDGTGAILMITTNLVTEGGKPVAFQHIARDVTEEKLMRENLQFYLRQITRAQEEERKRIARELHDDTVQYLVVLTRQLDDLASSSKGLSREEKLKLEDLRQQVNNIMEGVRRMSHDLRPATLDRLGLLPALEWLGTNVEKHSGIKVEVTTLGSERRLPAEVEIILFRIAQEALSNVRKHSQATNAEVRIEFGDNRIQITVKDNGKGFALPETVGNMVKEGRLGLAGMHERIRLLNGSLKIDSEPGKGTTVTVEAPL